MYVCMCVTWRHTRFQRAKRTVFSFELQIIYVLCRNFLFDKCRQLENVQVELRTVIHDGAYPLATLRTIISPVERRYR